MAGCVRRLPGGFVDRVDGRCRAYGVRIEPTHLGTLYASALFPQLCCAVVYPEAKETAISSQQAPKLSVSAIVDAAIDVADRDGLAALSMRRIADELGVGAMSLYRHIADKDALIVEMADEIGRRFTYPYDQPGPWTWRERVQIVLDVDWQLFQRHPWVVLAYSSPRYSFGSESLRCLDWFAAGFLDLGVDIVEATQMAMTVWSHIHGAALAAVGDQFLHAEPSDRPSGLVQVIEGQRSADDAARLPGLSQLAARQDTNRLTDPRILLDAGIDALCAGFEARARR